MKFSAVAVLAAVAGVNAWGNVTYTTEVVTEYTTYCPEPTTLTYGEKTYTVTEATTLTITDCPCTISKPIITTSSVVCYDCPAPTLYPNTTISTAAPAPPATTTAPPEVVPTAGAGKVAALSGAGLAAVLGLAALL